jgi:hypothetical protein
MFRRGRIVRVPEPPMQVHVGCLGVLNMPGVGPEYWRLLRRHHERLHVRCRCDPVHVRQHSFDNLVVYMIARVI